MTWLFASEKAKREFADEAKQVGVGLLAFFVLGLAQLGVLVLLGVV